MAMTSDVRHALQARLEAQCAKREYCSSDIRAKARKALADAMARTGVEPDAGQLCAAVDSIVAALVAGGFVSDLRYASAFAREKSSLTGWGPVKIRYALSAKGIPRDLIDAALSEIDTHKAEARLDKLLAAKARTLEGDPHARLKLLKFALSRGYEYDEAAGAVETALRG